MPRKTRWTIIPFIIVASLVLLVLYFLTTAKNSKPSEPLNAVPLSASIIIKVNDPEGLLEKTENNNPIWNELRQLPLFSKINLQLKFIDSLAGLNPDVNQIISNPPLFISLHLTGKDRISAMHIFRLPARISHKDLKAFISSQVLNKGTITARKYEGTEINEVMLLDKSSVGNFHFAVYRNILMLSFSATVLEDAIRQLASGVTFADDPGFKRIYATAGKNVDANVFINFNEFPKSLSSFIRAEHKSELRRTRDFADWAELDLNPLSEMLLMNGFVNSTDSVPKTASILVKQSPRKILADEVLPSSVSAFFALALSEPEKYFDDYRELLRNEGRLASYANTLQSVNNAYGTRFPEDFIEIMDQEIALAIDGNFTEATGAGVFFLVKIKSRTQAEAKFRSIVTAIAEAETKTVDSFITPYRFDADLTFAIYELPVRKLISKVFGPAFAILDKHYFVVLDNYMVFSNSVESLKSFISDFILNRTLVNDQAYKEFKRNLSPRSNLFFYCDLSRSQPFFSEYLNPSVSEAWQKNLSVFQKIRMAGLQLYENNNMLYSNLLIRHAASFSSSAQTVWESRLDTMADFKPVFTLNHQTGENEVFVQDLKNNIYLINQVGRILWKIQLPEAILSEIYQIDYFRNGKLQLLFSTRSRIYLIDRNGNFVDKYPLTLRSNATNGVAVFDYDNNRDYRIFIACSDRHVYAYNREGNLLDGWEFGQSESEVTQPLNHFRIGDRDFIVFGDAYKTYILDRRGTTRLNVETYFQRSEYNNYVINTSSGTNGPSVVTTDTAGKVYFIGFNGDVRTVELPVTYTNRHYFDYKDLTGDNRPEYIFLEGDRLTVFTGEESRLFTFRFGKPVRSKPAFYQFSSTDRKLGVVSREENL
ncbi:MAG TPA: DUF3352 domain-containing protein, partial [Bacteroidales bacterium]|nr:DUF3352 domain-containing protein [Bacteroidales bacterium]